MNTAHNIVTTTCDTWTAGLGPKEARIAVFERIRNIPYAIIPELRDPLRGPAGIVTLNKGSCQPKHYLLAQCLKRLDVPVRYATYPFRWSESDVRYPDELKAMLPQLPVGYHLAVKAHIDGRWILVDATWDMPLEAVGFPVNGSWDGSSDTRNAVTPIEEILHGSADDRVRYEAERRARQTEREKELYAIFIEKLNRWLNDVRSAQER